MDFQQPEEFRMLQELVARFIKEHLLPLEPGVDAEQGAAFVWFGPVSGRFQTDEADITLTGSQAGDRFGAALGVGGDLNGYGWADLVVGAPEAAGGDGEALLFAFDRM